MTDIYFLSLTNNEKHQKYKKAKLNYDIQE